ncbi:hypothetical protein H8K32_03855 [Undibacterium jejuense]|uniref:Uncharacterized protein n=1 Tax=Undibacterium jejuense TaxID=1344949 RepID=A0A923KNJ0_9BURK|nr:hypothetical protein [Undibacterium jejuense]MBC3861224.1 hypothetical protein [Undibacterium jejuense]
MARLSDYTDSLIYVKALVFKQHGVASDNAFRSQLAVDLNDENSTILTYVDTFS